MANLFEYAERFGGIKFNEIGLTEADNAIFSRLAYCDFSEYAGKTLGEISKLLNISDESAENKKSTAYLTQHCFCKSARASDSKTQSFYKHGKP